MGFPFFDESRYQLAPRSIGSVSSILLQFLQFATIAMSKPFSFGRRMPHLGLSADFADDMLLAIWADESQMVVVRQAVEADLPQAAALWRDRIAILQQTDRHCRPTSDSRADWLESASVWLTDERTEFLVAFADAKLAGYLVVSVVAGIPGQDPNRVGRVQDMALELHRSHPGLGSALLKRARDWLRSQEILVVTVDVPAHYPVESAFWRAQGGQQRFVQHWLSV